MKLPAGFQVGTATHTGLLRGANEDDFLLLALPPAAPTALLCAIADGMGGAAGGAEASRAALRGLGAAALAGLATPGAPPPLGDAFAAATARVREQAALVPALRDMGTTLTALWLQHGTGALGHVGDTRAFRCRDGTCEQLTVDHALRVPDNVLTRCIGGGQEVSDPDLLPLPLAPGDRLLLVSDGVWGTVEPARLAEVLATLPPQAAADRLVRLALDAGGPDNATAVVVHVGEADDAPQEVELPRAEASRAGELRRFARSLRSPLWPWGLLAVAVVLLVLSGLRWWFGIDAFAWLRARLA